MLHEGAKAAAYCQHLCTRAGEEERKRHPWGDELLTYGHLGWIGGAANRHRSDWSKLKGGTVKEVVIVADNDDPGRRAVSSISKLLAGSGITVQALMFDDKFPEKFDLADPWPEKLLDKGASPRLRDMLVSATWATQLARGPSGTRGRPPFNLRGEFLREWRVIRGLDRPAFVNIHERSRWRIETSVDALVRPFSDVGGIAAKLIEEDAYQLDGLTYRPGKKELVINVNGFRKLNMWQSPEEPSEFGDPGPWLEFLAHLFPDVEERHHVMRWLATLIAKPDVRMQYALLLISARHGVGKSTLAKVLKKVLGPWNVVEPSETDVAGDYTAYFANKQLAFIQEIYQGGSWKTYNSLKSKITEDTFRVNEKHQVAYEIELRVHFIMCSNSPRALSLDKNDRRIFVPEVTEEIKERAYWEELNAWIETLSQGAVLRWARDFVAQHGHVSPGEHPPMTKRKKELIEESRSPAQALAEDLVETARAVSQEAGQDVVLVEREIKAYIDVRVSAKSYRPGLAELRRWIAGAGMMVTAERISIDGAPTHCFSFRTIIRRAADAKALRRTPEWLWPEPGDQKAPF